MPPIDLQTDTETIDGVTLVTCRLHNETRVARGVRVRNALDGRTLPPRRRGRPVAGWNGDRYAAVVAPQGTVAFGYASPVADPADPPARVAFVGEPAAVADGAVGGPSGAPRPDPPVASQSTAAGPDTTANPDTTATPDTDDGNTPDEGSSDDPRADDSRANDPPAPTLPAPVAAYLAGARDRLARARQTDDSVAAAGAALADGSDPATAARRRDREVARLRDLARRAEQLADEADPVATDALGRLS